MSLFRLTFLMIAIGTLAMLTAGAREAQAQPALIKIGQLDCAVLESTRQNFIVTSTAEVNCVFGGGTWPEEYYRGVTGVQLGVDLSLKNQEQMSFLVYTSPAIGQGGPLSLTGKYYGAQASVTIGAGVGAFVLLGGSERQFTLAPLGGSVATGSGVTAGIGYLYLEPTQ